ncbi:hypothetical protein FQN53_008449, partial [Emmonsiellopsis sp. PD_33]
MATPKPDDVPEGDAPISIHEEAEKSAEVFDADSLPAWSKSSGPIPGPSPDDAERGTQEKINLNSNLSAKIKNPLANIPKGTLMRDVAEFSDQHGLNDILPTLQKGALIAKDPPNFENIEGITDDEVDAIRNEVLHKWRQPRPLYFTIILCSIGAAVQYVSSPPQYYHSSALTLPRGWDQTGSNGANLSFPQAFNLPEKDHPDANLNQWIVGIVNAGPYIASAFL